MSEATVQARLIAAVVGLVAEDSVLVNDYHTPQVASQERSPWLIVETGDDVTATTGEAWSDYATAYRPYVSLLTYRGNRAEKDHLDAFQRLRERVIAALLHVENVTGVATAAPIAPYFTADDQADPDSLFQRLVVDVIEYEG